MTGEPPMDADELMNLAERIELLPPADAEWVNRLFMECLRARMHEAELLTGLSECSTPSANETHTYEAQLAQVALDTAEWLKTLWNVGYMGAGSFPAQPRSAFPLVELEDVLKSALFARIREGKRPLPFPPPTRNGLPWHDLVDNPSAIHEVDAEIVRDSEHRALGAIIAACRDWQIVEEVTGDSEYLVQHRGMGPLFRLQIYPHSAQLKREPPRWTRQIRLQERGGFRSFTLDWPQADTGVQSVPLRATTWERAESEAEHWIASRHPEMYGQVTFERFDHSGNGV